MKTTLTLVLTLAIFVSSLIFTSGCEEPKSSTNRRAMLVGNENLELKKQLKLRNEELQKQKELLAKCEKEKLETRKQGEVVSSAIMQMGHEDKQKIQKLTTENLELKSRIKALEAESNKQEQ